MKILTFAYVAEFNSLKKNAFSIFFKGNFESGGKPKSSHAFQRKGNSHIFIFFLRMVFTGTIKYIGHLVWLQMTHKKLF